MNKSIFFLLALISLSIYAESPESIECEVRLNTSSLLSPSSTEGPTLDDLWDNSEEKLILKKIALAGEGVATVEMRGKSLKAYYSYNSQRGHIELQDKMNDLYARTDWSQDSNLGSSHYSYLFTSLTKKSGNLFGIKEAFNASVGCRRLKNK